MQLVNMRRLFVFSALLLLLVNGAWADGTYQRTKDRKTLVWNNEPKASRVATWSGDRDADGYGTGYGTLTWYSVEEKFVTGSNIPFFKQTVVATYSGNMARGKPAPAAEQRSNKRVADQAAVAQPESPAAGPSPSPAPDKKRGEEAAVETPTEGPSSVSGQALKQQANKSAVKQTPSRDMDDSLRSLVGPPSLLRKGGTGALPQASAPPAASSSPARSRLTSAEVIELANAEARTQGYNLEQFQNPQTRYTAADEIWSVFYEQKSVDGVVDAGKHFSVSVEDKTKKASIAAER
jgi:hypothetical protein